MKTLLGLIRYPEESRDFIHYLVELATDLDTKVLLHYVEDPVNYPLGTNASSGVAMAHLQMNLEDKIKKGKKILDEVVMKMIPQIAGEAVIEVFAEMGDEKTILKEMVSSGKVQMVAMEYNESDGLWQKDAIAMDVVRTIDCPVWVIPENSDYQHIKSIIYATDYHEEDISTLRNLIALTHHLSPKIIALHITENADFDSRIKNAGFQKMLETKTEYTDISAKALIEKNKDDLVKLIISYATMNSADLIVVLKENKNFIERIFNPSSSEKIIQASDKPVLVYHPKELNI